MDGKQVGSIHALPSKLVNTTNTLGDQNGASIETGKQLPQTGETTVVMASLVSIDV